MKHNRMPNTLEYKGYVGKFSYQEGDENFHGLVLGLNDMIAFQGKDIAELRQSLAEGVEDYLAWCREDGREPEKPYSGNLRLRLPAALHRRIAILAQGEDVSLNDWMVRALAEHADMDQDEDRAA